MVDNLPDFEPILEYLGVQGKFQLQQITLQVLGIFCLSFPVMIGVFTGYEPPHECAPINVTEFRALQSLPDQVTVDVTYEKCSINVKVNDTGGNETSYVLGCVNGHNYYGGKYISYTAEMDLVCDKNGIGELSQTLLMLGQGIGCFIFTSLADRFGRKPIYVFTTFGLTILHALIAAAPEVVSLTFFRFLIGGFQQGVCLSCFTLFLEMMPPAHRMMITVVCGVLWSTSLMVLALVAWLMQHHSWRTLQYVMVATPSFCVLLPWYIVESPRWLACNNRPDEALEVFRKWCHWNKSDFSHVKKLFEINVIDKLRIRESLTHKTEQEQTQLHVEKYTIIDVFRHKTVFVTSLIICFVWVTNGVTYFGLILTSSSLAGNRFMNFFLSGLAEIPAVFAAFFMHKKLNRKVIETVFLIMAAICLTTSVLLLLGEGDRYTITSTVFSLLGKFAITAAFNSLYLYTPELYPTNLRSVGLGLASALSRFGGMVAPYSRFLMEIAIYGPGTIFSAMCVVSALLVQLLPETKGRALPNSIKELKQWKAQKIQGKNGELLTSGDNPGPDDVRVYRYSLVESWIREDLEESEVM